MIVRILIEFNFNMAHITTGLISFLMVFILVMQGNVSRTLPEGAINMINDFECYIDSECLENNTYCDVRLNLCAQCLDCNNYFRMPKKNIKCPKNILDCSICVDGYVEETFFGGEIRDLCVPIDSNVILPTAEKISSSFYWQDVGIIFIIINMFLIFLLWTYFYKRFWNTDIHVSNALQDSVEILPPSYDSCLKTDNYVTDDVQEFHLFTGEQPPRNEWRHQNAVPFRLLEDTQEINNHTDENENIEEIDGVVMREIEDPELHDEETMPSVWTPPPPSSPETTSTATQFQNNNSQFCSPPFKRIRLELQSTNDKNEENEGNTSGMSQD